MRLVNKKPWHLCYKCMLWPVLGSVHTWDLIIKYLFLLCIFHMWEAAFMTDPSNRESYERQNLTWKTLQQCILMCSYFVKTQHATTKCLAIKRQLAPTVLNKEWERESKCLHPMINLAGSCNSTARNSFSEYTILKRHILHSESASPDCVSVSVMMVYWLHLCNSEDALEEMPLLWAFLLSNRRETYTDKCVCCCKPNRKARMNADTL